MLTLRQVVDLYVNLLLFEYKSGLRARQTISILVKQALGDMLASVLQDAFNLGTAVGAQLDVLGKYIGLPRTIGDPVAQPYFGFWDMTQAVPALQNPNGFVDYADPSVNAAGVWFQYQFSGSENTALTDAAYIFMLRLKIVLNSNDGSLASIQQFLHEFLPGIVALVDNADMSMTYTLSNQIPVSPTVLEKYLPKPMGVRLIFVVMTASLDHDTLTHTTLGVGNLSSTAGPTTATPANGIGPYSYQWVLVSLTGVAGGDSFYAVNPTSAATQFTFLANIATLVSPPKTAVGVYRCVVSDSRGIVAISEEVTVTLTCAPPP